MFMETEATTDCNEIAIRVLFIYTLVDIGLLVVILDFASTRSLNHPS